MELCGSNPYQDFTTDFSKLKSFEAFNSKLGFSVTLCIGLAMKFINPVPSNKSPPPIGPHCSKTAKDKGGLFSQELVKLLD